MGDIYLGLKSIKNYPTFFWEIKEVVYNRQRVLCGGKMLGTVDDINVIRVLGREGSGK